MLREVGNLRPLAAFAYPARKRAEADNSPVRHGRSVSRMGAPLAAGGVEQALEGDADDDEDVIQSDGEGHVRSIFGECTAAQAAAAGISHPLARRAAAVAAPQRAPGSAQLPPPVYKEDEDEEEEQEGEMHAEVGAGAFPSRCS